MAAQPFVCGGFEPLVAIADGPETPGHIVISAGVCMGRDGFDFGMLRVRYSIIGRLSITTKVQIGRGSGRSCHLGCALDVHLQKQGKKGVGGREGGREGGGYIYIYIYLRRLEDVVAAFFFFSFRFVGWLFPSMQFF